MEIVLKPVQEAFTTGILLQVQKNGDWFAGRWFSAFILFPEHLVLEVIRFASKMNGQGHARLVFCLDGGWSGYCMGQPLSQLL